MHLFINNCCAYAKKKVNNENWHAPVHSLGALDHGPVGLEVVDGEAVGGVELGDQGAVLAGDEDGALAGRLLGVVLVLHVHAGVAGALLQSLGGRVLACETEKTGKSSFRKTANVA